MVLYPNLLFPRKTEPATPQNDNDQQPKELRRTESTSSYMQRRRNIYVNMELPASEYDENGQLINRHYASNRIRTAKYTTVSFIPKNLFEQLRNVANIYFAFLVILQCIPVFGVTEPAVSALPLMAILLITAIKDAFEDWKRDQSDKRVNHAHTRTLRHWRNVNTPIETKSTWYILHVFVGFFCSLVGAENKYTISYRMSRLSMDTNSNKIVYSNRNDFDNDNDAPPNESSTVLQQPGVVEPKHLLTTVRHRSDTLRSELSSIFKSKRQPYRPGNIPHSVLYRTATSETPGPPVIQTISAETQENHVDIRQPAQHLTRVPTGGGGCVHTNCATKWDDVQWQDLHVGDYVQIRNDEDVPADVVVLSTSEADSLCYIETQNLDGETNLKVRQGLEGTADIRTEHDCEQASFYIESEPPHVNLYQYNAVMRWPIDPGDTGTVRSGVSHEKSDAINYNNILLRGCVLRNTEWVIGIVVFTGNDTKIMLNSGKTPSKRSKLSKATNPHIIANFAILAILCILSSVIESVQFNASGSSRKFDYNIEGLSASLSGFMTFWVTLILYQNIVPISLYISVEIVKSVAAYFIHVDIDLYHEETDTPCIPKTWNISDDLGQIEYVFSDKTGTLTQNVMEYRKCSINGISYGLGKTDAQMGASKRSMAPSKKIGRSVLDHGDDGTDQSLYNTSIATNNSSITDQEEDSGTGGHGDDIGVDVDELADARKEMFDVQATLYKNTHIGSNPTFVDPQLFYDLAKNDSHANAVQHFFLTLALCHTVIAERPDAQNQDLIEYKAQSPDEAALVATARDMGFVFLGREANTIYTEIKGERKSFDILNTLEFNSTRKRMSVIIRPHDSDKIVLLCKGADSVIYERLCNDFGSQDDLKLAQLKLQDICSTHLENYANEGLRTLCLAYRFIATEDYLPWQRRYQDACSSIVNREERVEAVSEDIEKNMLLMGGTAIEDRLQEGVPETISELAKSGIKLWVLTGDKTETAINIGFACNLLTTEMELIVLRATSREETSEKLTAAMELSESRMNNEDNKIDFALIVDGTTLKYGLESDKVDMLLTLGMRCKSVICCRVSPKQKAQVVNMVKKRLKVMTLAIGDGANDVSMIQEANVGIGISGVEGRQAVMASDYAIAQFRFLRKLLLVHGRWSYLRTSEMILGFFFKNIVWTFVLFWYQIFCQFNGTMMFDYSLVTLYNLVFTSLPIAFLGIWDQDLDSKTTLRYPELYRMGLRNDKFKKWYFWAAVADSIYQSVVCFFFPYMLLLAGGADPSGHDANGVYEIGTIISGIAVCVANLYVVLTLYSYTWIQVLIVSLSILLYFVFIAIYSQFNTFIFAGHIRLFGNGLYWLVLILTIVAAFIPRIIASHYMHQYHPYDNDIIREIELVLKRRHHRGGGGKPNQDDGITTNDIKLEEN
ncbi:hypothetical protein BCR42DRAFT_377204 [Absidia repens]|uniref:Phospholipid-transporting ATPase n=1 Tax=Absidia repens TaxID=90262 RepID=A0A1X2ICG2_9FUNG|nr:hypothetical protein BCR42DRAFT_377204 [Absidia repens]